MHHSDSTVRSSRSKHPVPILTHAAHRRHKKRRRIRLVWTPANVTLLIVLALAIGMLLGCAMSANSISDYVCDAFVHLAVC